MLKRNDAPSFASVAREIGEPRLELVLAQLARRVRIDIHNSKFVRKRSEIRSSVKKLKADARRFCRTMERVRTFELPFHDLRESLITSSALPQKRTLELSRVMSALWTSQT